MRILIFTTQFFRLSGIERLAIELVVDLNRRGIHADLLSMYSEDGKEAQQASEHLRLHGVPRVMFLGLRVNPTAGSVAAGIMRLRRLLSAGAYDLVETSSTSPTVVAACARIGTRTQHIAGLHDAYSRSYYYGRKYALLTLAVKLARTRFYAISATARNAWIDFSATPAERTRVVYNGIADDWFSAVPDRDGLRRELGIDPASKLVVFVGRLMKRKGIDTLLAAVGPSLTSWNAHLLYVGEPDDPSEWLDASERDLLPHMHAEIERESWGKRVHFLGRRIDVPRIMASSDVLAHPARLEAFGLVLAEALATGTPVVASDVQGIPEVLAGSESMLVPPENPVALRNAIEQVFSRPDIERERARAAGKARAEYFRTRRRTDELIRLFEDTISGRL